MSDPVASNSYDHARPLLPAAPERAGKKGALSDSVQWKYVIFFFLLVSVAALSGGMDLLARGFLERFGAGAVDAEEEVAAGVVTEAEAVTALAFKDLDLHPDLLFRPYLGGEVIGNGEASSANLIQQFRDFLSVYEQRQGADDNFTIRVLDDRSGETLELAELNAERAKYAKSGQANWDQIDRLRRNETNRLLGKWAGRGIPKQAISVRWGRADQVREARLSEQPFIEYEVRLARYLGLSLLATEIGTVETFNQDRLVSTVGARSRYQMMPYLLSSNGIVHYDLRSANGRKVPVLEEWHPLLSMEPAFTTLKGYVNSVGHELPGISAYHTGPGNIYSLYRQYLVAHADLIARGATVMDAYMWALTEGFDRVSSNSSFKQYSRGYVATAYGSLKAMEDEPLDPSQTMLTERVRLKPGQQIALSMLLSEMEKEKTRLRGLKEGETLYEAFRRMNPHIDLEPSSQGVPASSDVLLVSETGGTPVRFFLPLGSSELSSMADWIDGTATFRYDEKTYMNPAVSGEKTELDRAYEQFVAETAGFGFTPANRQRLNQLKAQFEALAEANPTHYRQKQLEIIRAHAGLWNTTSWDNLASATAAVEGLTKAAPRPIAAGPGSTLQR